MKKVVAMLCLAGAMTLSANAASDKATLDSRVQAATDTLRQIMSVPDKAIPNQIASQATCIAVVPGLSLIHISSEGTKPATIEAPPKFPGEW